jgi:hypothetical protein
MAKLKNLDSLFTMRPRQVMTVGNNRTVECVWISSKGAGKFRCRLHGHEIVTATTHGAGGTVTIHLDACGYLTSTTIAAMRDFMGAFGVAGSASRAGGILSARWFHDGAWHDRDSTDGESMSFAADRHPSTTAQLAAV